MYQKDDIVIYGNAGVCRITDISKLDFDEDDDGLYYTLEHYYDRNRVIYVPVEGAPRKIRPIISKEAAQEFIERLPSIEPGDYANEKERKEAYREVMLSADMEQWASMIHFIHRREEERAAKGQKISTHYMEEMKGVERLLLGELAVALEIPYDEMKEYIRRELETHS